jgi:hypothetical protein
MQNAKKILPFIVLALLIFIPFNTVSAYVNGLLDGKALTYGINVTDVKGTTVNATDNNTSTFWELDNSFTSTNDYLYYTFSSPVNLTSYRLNSTGGTVWIRAYDSVGTQIYSTSTPVTSGVETNFSVNNVSKITIHNSAQEKTKVYEFDVFKPMPIEKTEITNLTVNSINMTSAVVNWNNPTGYSGVTYNGAKIYLNGILKASSNATNTSYNLSGLTLDTSYTIKVTATYSDGTETTGLEKTFKTLPEPPDTTPPSKPTGLIAEYDGSAVNLSFSANTESDLSYYNIYRDGTKLGTVTTNSFKDTSAKDGKTYAYEVSAVDKAGNASEKSDVFALSIAEVLDVNFIPNADSIFVQIAEGNAPYTIKWGTQTKSVNATSYKIDGLTLNTDYVVTVTDNDGLTATKSINTGKTKNYIPAQMPSIGELFQKMLDSFGSAGTIALAIIGGAVALGIITVLGMFGWRTFKKWLSSAK